MPNTFSIFNGQVIESSSKEDLFSLLEFLPDNTQKLIRPRDVRDAFLTTWSNSTFKLTSTSGNNKYIGIDSGNPNNKDVKAKILLGKRSVGSFDVMSDSLLNTTDTDIFFFNTKSDSENQDKTKISILAGDNRTLYSNAPYIESEKNSNSIDFNIINPSPGGSLNISSSDSIVNINGISFPTIADTEANVGNNKILKYSGIYPFGGLEWSDLETNNVKIGSTNSTTNIYGNPVNLNGYSLEFVDDDIVPLDIGGVKQGDSFSENTFQGATSSQNWPLTEIIRKIIYPEINPELDFNIFSTDTDKYIEINSSSQLNLTYSIKSFPRETSERVSSWFIRNNPNSSSWDVLAQGGPLGSNPGVIFNDNTNIQEISQTLGILEYELLVSIRNDITLDPTNSDFGYEFKLKSNIEVIKPFFGTINNQFYETNSTGMSSIITSTDVNKVIKPYPGDGNSIEIYYQGNGYIYFAQPNEYSEVKQIKDENGFIIYDINDLGLSFFDVSTSPITPFSPYNYYGSYKIYRSKNKVNLNTSFKLEIIY